MAEIDRRQARLAAALKALRKAAALSQGELAQRARWVQPKISRLENGVQPPTEDDIWMWVRHTGASAIQTEALLDMFSATHVEYTPTADLLRRGTLGRRQAHLGAMEAAASRIGEYQPALIPGLLQLPNYTRAMLRLPGSVSRTRGDAQARVDEIITARLRRQELIQESGRSWQFVIGETALWSAPGGLADQASQLDHLLAVSELPGVDLRIIPSRGPMPIMPLSGFRILDEEFVYVETLHGEQRYHEMITNFIDAFDTARQAAVAGPDAVALIQRIAIEQWG
ncbi:MAG: DUF5753 domain-containing protein [Pseudonocardiaceae bacterium]